MLYLKSITLDKFKSFRHAELLLSKGFTCIVGPNGSGKSVIFDALSVALGEPSPQQLRVTSLGQLINNTVKPKQGEFAKAHIKLEFDGGDEPITVTKTVRSDSKTLYKLNGKTMTRREVIEFFSKNSVRVDDTTTIAQGEIDGLSKLNSKQRRELIDVAAGIKEFEYKKTEAMRELEKVDQRISEANVMLSERQGFLRELEKEKEAAEAWLQMGKRVRLLTYSVLKVRQAGLKASFEQSTKDMSILDARKMELSAKKVEIGSRRDQLNAEVQQLQAEFSKMNSTSGEIRARLENLNNELARLEVEIPNLAKSLDELNYTITQSNAELKEATERIKEDGARVLELDKTISRLDAEIGKAVEVPDDVDFEAEVNALEALIQGDENKLVELQNYISKLQADISIVQSRKADTEKQGTELMQRRNDIASRKEKSSNAVTDAKARSKKSEARIGELDEQRAELSRTCDRTDEEILELKKQQWMYSQSRDGSLATRLSEKFSQSDGFYGKAAGLCTYEGTYATAIETAATNRFDYYVVDSIKSASVFINFLKKNGLGRATFIPMAEVSSPPVSSVRADGMRPLLDFINYDKKFARVFSYIFGNTYLINDPNDAKRFGIGKHRYVTIDGELIEGSGIISGGSQKARVSLAAVESRLKAVTDENEKAKKLYHSTDSALQAESKEYALINMQMQQLSADLGLASNELIDTDRKMASLKDQLAGFDAEVSRLSKEVEQKDREKLEVASALNRNKDARKAAYDKLTEATRGSANSKKMKEEKARIEAMRNEAQDCRVKRGSLNTEMGMLQQKCSVLSKSVETKKAQLKDVGEQLKSKELRKEVVLKSKGEIERDAASKSESTKKVIARIQAITEDVGKLSGEYGRLDAEITSIERQITEIRIRRQGVETTLNDITAELKAYDESVEAVKGRLEEMNAEIGVLKGKIEALGNVNQKAPETYEANKKLVEEASLKVSTLQTEKEAVLRMIEEIDSKKLQTFMDMLNEVNKGFMRLYNYVFPGKASIVLEDDKDPLNSGIFIKINNGKSDTQFMSMSGGERAIISLMLLFAIHMGKKSAFYIFDEVDAALDKENAKKLSMLIKEMSKEAQFIVISHNDSLIVNSDAAIGVVKTEGESKAYGVDVANIIKKG